MRLPNDLLQQCWFLAGPTACGKTETALLLAERLDAEVVSLDSMALYRGMDIGTAKPTVAERERVPHHLVDVIDPNEEYSVADYLAASDSACRQILAGGKTPLFVGGTGLYLRSLLRGVFEGPAADWDYRRQLEAEAASHGDAVLHAQLERIDPESAASLHPNDQRRVIRALEVHHVTGRPLSEQQQHPPLPEASRPRHVYWLDPPRPWLHERINRRVEQMIAAGLVEEVRTLLRADPPMGRTARQGLGYKEVIAHLEGEASLDTTIEMIQTRTRQFAKRQYTWFRNLEECRSVDISGDETPEDLARTIAAGEVQ